MPSRSPNPTCGDSCDPALSCLTSCMVDSKQLSTLTLICPAPLRKYLERRLLRNVDLVAHLRAGFRYCTGWKLKTPLGTLEISRHSTRLNALNQPYDNVFF